MIHDLWALQSITLPETFQAQTIRSCHWSYIPLPGQGCCKKSILSNTCNLIDVSNEQPYRELCNGLPKQRTRQLTSMLEHPTTQCGMLCSSGTYSPNELSKQGT